MSKVITVTAAADTEITFLNTYGTEYAVETESARALKALDPFASDDVWNTGAAIVGDPHIDEIVNGQKMAPAVNPAILTDPQAWKARHIVAIPLFRSNATFFLLPGDSLVLTTNSAEEAAYYLTIHDEDLQVTSSAITEGADRAEEGADLGTFLGRTTGVGDADDGDAANGVYPFQENTEGLGVEQFEITVNDGTASPATAAKGMTVTITAGTAPEGKTFDAWTVVTPNTLTLTDDSQASTTFTMPGEAVEVTATWKNA